MKGPRKHSAKILSWFTILAPLSFGRYSFMNCRVLCTSAEVWRFRWSRKHLETLEGLMDLALYCLKYSKISFHFILLTLSELVYY